MIQFENWNQLTALATVALVFATLVATVWVVLANRRAMREDRAPYLIMYIFPNKRIGQKLELVIENIGREPAFHVNYKIMGNVKDPEAFWSSFEPNLCRRVEIIPPGRKIVHEVGVTHQVLSRDPGLFLNMGVTYKDKHGVSYDEEYSSRPSDFLGTAAENDPLVEIQREIKKIRDIMNNLPFQHDGFFTITETRSERDVRRDRAMRENEEFFSGEKVDDRYQLNQSQDNDD